MEATLSNFWIQDIVWSLGGPNVQRRTTATYLGFSWWRASKDAIATLVVTAVLWYSEYMELISIIIVA